jgi:hypothetical protein
VVTWQLRVWSSLHPVRVIRYYCISFNWRSLYLVIFACCNIFVVAGHTSYTHARSLCLRWFRDTATKTERRGWTGSDSCLTIFELQKPLRLIYNCDACALRSSSEHNRSWERFHRLYSVYSSIAGSSHAHRSCSCKLSFSLRIDSCIFWWSVLVLFRAHNFIHQLIRMVCVFFCQFLSSFIVPRSGAELNETRYGNCVDQF